ncbi:hypothetical protein C8J55DRAFT_497601 [Lentinula edodes]|uniref:Secreted protein n=1 Tax=Lentinula lateritia TaxID=40482 RepID=A0A9W9B068_9AGAR|nr:hypothetical protein C8J55DRAFT_497601 [Lentinula edodes]
MFFLLVMFSTVQRRVQTEFLCSKSFFQTHSLSKLVESVLCSIKPPSTDLHVSYPLVSHVYPSKQRYGDGGFKSLVPDLLLLTRS